MGRGQATERNLLYGQAPTRGQAPSLLGLKGKPVLLPRLPGEGGTAALGRGLVADLVRAYFDMGPEERKTRHVGVLRYLMHLLKPGFEDEAVTLEDLDGLLGPLTTGDEVEVKLTDAEWRSVYRVLELGHARDMMIPAASAERAMKELFDLSPGALDIDVECRGCGCDVGAQDCRLVEGRWVGEVCCLGRRRMVPADAFPEDAVNFGRKPRAPRALADDRRHGRPRGSGTGRRPVGPGR